MGLAAKIENNTVTQVIVVPFMEDWTDAAVTAYCNGIGLDGTWLRTSYTGDMRGKYAGIGDTYDPETDAFVSPVPAE
jgi:hypothetical protein